MGLAIDNVLIARTCIVTILDPRDVAGMFGSRKVETLSPLVVGLAHGMRYKDVLINGNW